MPWLIGKIFKLIVVLLILAAIVIGGLMLFVNPNEFKDNITNHLQAATGQTFTIPGDVEWSLRPRVAISIPELTMNGNSTFKQVTIAFDFWSLLSNTIVVEDVEIAQANITVDAQAQKPQIAKVESQSISIKNATLKDTTINFVDTQSTFNWQLRNGVLCAEDFTLNGGITSAPIKLQGDLVNTANNQVLNINTKIQVKLDQNSLSLDPLDITWHDTTFSGNGTLTQTQAPILSAKLSLKDTETAELLQKLNPYFNADSSKINHKLNVAVEFSYYVADKILDLQKIDLGLDNGTLTGSLKVGFTAPYQSNFELNASDLDLKPLILLMQASMPTTQFSNVPLEILRHSIMSGKFDGKNLKFTEDFAIDQISMQMIAQDSKLQIAPLTFNAYGSINTMTLYVDVTGETPFIRVTEQANNLELSRWLQLLGVQRGIDGTAMIKASLEGLGTDLPSLLSTLKGGVNITIAHGTYYGFNLNSLADFEIDLIRDSFTKLTSGQGGDLQNILSNQSSKWIDGQKNDSFTKFSRLDFKATFADGISKESSITVETDSYTLLATGEINFATNSLNLNGTITSKNPPQVDIAKLAKYLQDTPFTMSITGTPSQPIFKPDIRSYASKSIALLLDAALQTATTRMVEATPPNQATTKTANELFIDSLKALGNTGSSD